MAVPLNPPSELNGRRFFQKVQQSSFFLNGRPLTSPPPALMARPLKMELLIWGLPYNTLYIVQLHVHILL